MYIAVWNIEFASRNNVFFVFNFVSVQFKYSVMGPCILIKLINFWWSRLTALPVSTTVTIKWDCFENHFFALFLVICYELSITWTPDSSSFFWLPWRFKLSGVNCIEMFQILLLCFETLTSRAILNNWRWPVGLCFQWQMKKKCN